MKTPIWKTQKAKKFTDAEIEVMKEQALQDIKQVEAAKNDDRSIKQDELAAKPDKKKKATATQEKVSFLQPLIESGKHSQSELVEKAVEKFPTLTESTIRTFLTDSKNPKYNKFEKLVVVDDEGKLTFKK